MKQPFDIEPVSPFGIFLLLFYTAILAFSVHINLEQRDQIKDLQSQKQLTKIK